MRDPLSPIRVLVVDDSASVRELLVRLIDGDGHFRVVGTARDGVEAVVLGAQLRPDVITMDLHLPRLDGVGAIRRIMAETPTSIVVVSTTSKDAPNGLAFEALRAGALTIVDKPSGRGDPRHPRSAQELLTAIRLMAEVKVVRRSATSLRASARVLPPAEGLAPRAGRPLALALAASTGGPQAIQTVLQALGADFDLPVLVVQHMSQGFLIGMAAWLAATCPQSVRLAAHGDEPTGGTVYVAPEDHHLLVTRRGTLTLSKSPPVSGFRPSANVLFESVAEYFGPNTVAAILSGMGDDGAAGMAKLRAAGASTIAQDEASSVVYGMPRAAAVSGAAEHVLPLASIGPTVRRLLGLKMAPQFADALEK
jgi:two-component system chemotaxis response regulator CheB